MELGKEEIVGYDFDGVLNRLPKPFEIFMRYTGPHDLLEQPRLKWLKLGILFFISALPINLDGEILDKVSRENPIISGRLNMHEEITSSLQKLGFSKIYLRPYASFSETEYKILKCKELKVSKFYEDRLYVIKRLQANGINAIDARELRNGNC